MAILESIGASAAQAGINYGINKMIGNDEQANFEKNQRAAFEYSQQAQRNAPRNLAEGMRDAGFSPALAAGQSFNAAPMSSPPMQNKAAPQMDMASMFQATKQLDLLDSEKANLDEQARELKIKNDRLEQEDAQYNTLLTNTVKRWKEAAPQDKELQALYDDILEHPDKFSKGTFDALKNATDYAAYVKEATARASKADLDTLVFGMQAKGGVYKDIANLPREELELMIEDQKLKRGLAANAYAQTKTEGEKLKTLQKQQKELEERAKSIEEETRRMRYGKYGNMYEHGDYDAAIAEILGGAADEGSKAVAREGAKLGADIVRAKTGTPHGMFESKTSQKPQARETRTDRYKDKHGEHEVRYDEVFFKFFLLFLERL